MCPFLFRLDLLVEVGVNCEQSSFSIFDNWKLLLIVAEDVYNLACKRVFCIELLVSLKMLRFGLYGVADFELHWNLHLFGLYYNVSRSVDLSSTFDNSLTFGCQVLTLPRQARLFSTFFLLAVTV